MHNLIQDEIKKLSVLLTQIQADQHLLQTVDDIASACITCVQNGGKILFAGNGGSAADSQHLAAELVTRLRFDRPGLAAMALNTDTSCLTAIGNDYAFDHIFSRQIEAIGREGDVFVGISTSGKSPNVLRALTVAKEKKLTTIGFGGAHTPLMAAQCDLILNVPSKETPKIQECHILFGHIICSVMEDRIFGADYDPMRKQAAEVA